MITIDKIRQYLKSISKSDEEYNKLLLETWVDPEKRNKECSHPEHETCENCPLNIFRKK